MILYNMIGWPYIYECTKDKLTVDKIHDETERAWAIVTQVDLTCEFATGIMTMVKNLSGGDSGKDKVDKEAVDLEVKDRIMTVFNQVKQPILKVRLKD
jgi:hypothetical protein